MCLDLTQSFPYRYTILWGNVAKLTHPLSSLFTFGLFVVWLFILNNIVLSVSYIFMNCSFYICKKDCPKLLMIDRIIIIT